MIVVQWRSWFYNVVEAKEVARSITPTLQFIIHMHFLARVAGWLAIHNADCHFQVVVVAVVVPTTVGYTISQSSNYMAAVAVHNRSFALAKPNMESPQLPLFTRYFCCGCQLT